MQANQRVYRLAAVGRLLFTDSCSAMRDLPFSKRPERAILDSRPPGIGGMSVYGLRASSLPRPSSRAAARTPLSGRPWVLSQVATEWGVDLDV
jgi:hypothetical protein